MNFATYLLHRVHKNAAVYNCLIKALYKIDKKIIGVLFLRKILTRNT